MAGQPTPRDSARFDDAPHRKVRAAEQSSAWDLVDEASWESFPASDPPCWTAGRDHRPDGALKAHAILRDEERLEQAEDAPEA